MATEAAKHTILGGKVHVYRRANSSQWQCATYLDGKNHRVSTKTESLAQAKDFAEDWYLGLKGKQRSGELVSEKTFKQAAALFEREYEIITEGQRSPKYVQTQSDRIRVHLMPFFGALGLSQITSGKIQEYRVHRMSSRKKKQADGSEVVVKPSRSSLHQEEVALRQVLKTGIRHGWLSHLPDMSKPYKTSGKLGHRAWFSPAEYTRLYTATRKRAYEAKGTRWAWERQRFHDYVLFMANTGMRPDEAARIQYRDVEIVHDKGTDETILEIAVRGKRGVGYCKSTTGAVKPFERLRERNDPAPSDLLFPGSQRELFNAVVGELGLKEDREGQRRTAYSLRHTYISMRLMEGADIYQIAKNCRTSVEMIEKFYAAHIKTNLDASAINRRKPTG